jgi:hypothetical protein
MRRGLSRGVRAAALAAVAGAGFSVHAANEIRVIVTFNNVQQQSFTVDSGAPITVDLGTPPFDTVALVRVFDEASGNNVPQFSTGPMVVRWNPGGGTLGRVRVLVAPPGSDFPDDGFTAVLQPGLLNFGGLKTADLTGFEYPVPFVTDFAGRIAGDLTGDISVGAVVFLEATGVTQPNGSVAGGNIDGNIRASDFFATPLNVPYAIDTIRAGNRIRGNIDGTSPTDQPTNINRVIVGPSPTA